MEICDSSNFLNVILLVKTIFQVLSMVIPFILIITLSISLIRYIMTNDEQLIIKLKAGIMNKIIAAVVVFLIPTLVTTVLDLLGAGTDLYTCYSNANSEYISQRKEAEEAQKELERQARLQAQIQAQQRAAQAAQRQQAAAAQGTRSYANELVYYAQWDYNTTYLCTASNTNIRSSGCGHTSLSIIAASFGNKRYTPVDIRNLLCNNSKYGYSGGPLGYWYYTNATLLDDLGLKSEKLFGYYANGDRTYTTEHANAILSAVQAGKGVIIYIPGHYVAVGQHPSCTTNQVYYYDPGNRGNRGCYTMRQLWDKTYNYSNRCTNNNSCGWKGAWAFVGK